MQLSEIYGEGGNMSEGERTNGQSEILSYVLHLVHTNPSRNGDFVRDY